jgi:hypothetical protein
VPRTYIPSKNTGTLEQLTNYTYNNNNNIYKTITYNTICKEISVPADWNKTGTTGTKLDYLILNSSVWDLTYTGHCGKMSLSVGENIL